MRGLLFQMRLMESRTGEQQIELRIVAKGSVYGDVDAVARAHRRAVTRKEPPFIELRTRESIGGAQWFDCGRERHHRKSREQIKADRVGTLR